MTGSVSAVETVYVEKSRDTESTIIAPRADRRPSAPAPKAPPPVATIAGCGRTRYTRSTFDGCPFTTTRILITNSGCSACQESEFGCTSGCTNTCVDTIRPFQLTSSGPMVILLVSSGLRHSTRTASAGVFKYNPSAPKFPGASCGPMISMYEFIPGAAISGSRYEITCAEARGANPQRKRARAVM
ncbi:MAG: hypothetical protein IPP94_05265 [Ignavibacteria bacterium]|nr:hypothetical protein [Ignavibacteria bacterium]